MGMQIELDVREPLLDVADKVAVVGFDERSKIFLRHIRGRRRPEIVPPKVTMSTYSPIFSSNRIINRELTK